MHAPTVTCRSPSMANGFTLLEVVFALLLLGVCLVPAANALQDALRAPANTEDAMRKLDCVSSLMETVLAEPYNRLLSYATSPYPPAPADSACPARQVTIARYGNNATGKIGPGATDDQLLYVSVALDKSADKSADGPSYTLTTLVAR
jgi:prepilin-type N-terminal cleavage/methylation domain-containing protein